MTVKALLELANFAELLICLGLVLVFTRKHLWKRFWAVGAYVAVRAAMEAISIPILFFRKDLGISRLVGYNILFYSIWPSVILEAIIMVLVVYSVYSLVLQPFQPLKKLGNIIFRWVAAISIAVALGVSVGPHMFGKAYAINVVSQIQQGTSILTLCLLLFVCFALRPLGLTFKSHAFGACLGLGILATMQLVQAAWLPTLAPTIYSPLAIYSGFAVCLALAIWAAYFAIPEPRGRMVLLPTTSPYFFWNKISEALGDQPGFVAVSGFSPDSLAPAELAALRASSSTKENAEPRMVRTLAVGR